MLKFFVAITIGVLYLSSSIASYQTSEKMTCPGSCRNDHLATQLFDMDIINLEDSAEACQDKKDPTRYYAVTYGRNKKKEYYELIVYPKTCTIVEIIESERIVDLMN